MKELLRIEIPTFIEDVKLSNARQIKYYEKGKKKLPKKYQSIDFEWKVLIKNRKTRILLYDKKNQKYVVANPRAAGTPKIKRISGNDFYAGFGSYHSRVKIVNEIKKDLKKYLRGIEPITEFPLIFEAEHHNIIGLGNWDSDNKFFIYKKCFQDMLTELGIIPDDSIRYITKAPEPLFVPIDTPADRKFVFFIYKDERDCITTNPFYNDSNNKSIRSSV